MAKNFETLRKKLSPERRAKAAARTQEMLQEMLLADIRQAAGLTQVEVAQSLEIQQSAVSKLENKSDMQISTLRQIIETYGGQLELIAHLPHGDVSLTQFTKAP